MAGMLQPLDEKFPIVDQFGKPTLYFIKWCQQRQIDITEALTLLGLEDYLLAHPLREGPGIAFTPSGNLTDSPEISVRNGVGLDFDGMDNLKLADTAVTLGTYGDATHVGQFTVDQQGRIVAAANVAISGGGSGAWTLAGSGFTNPGIWDFAVDGAISTFDFTNLGTPNEILIIMDAVTKSASGSVNIRVSTDNGVTFYSAGTDHFFMDTNGVATGSSVISQMHNTNATAARTAFTHIIGANGPRAIGLNLTIGTSHRIFRGSTSPINAVRIIPSAGGNFTGGAFYCKIR